MNYEQKPSIVKGEQFFQGVTPWPVPVHVCDAAAAIGVPGPHVHNGMLVPVVDSDWIVTDLYTGAVRVVPNSQFAARFDPAPVGRTAPLESPPLPDIMHHLR